jgi:GAF domain-containing protein
LNISTQHVTANQHCYVINDLSRVDCFKDKPFVADWPFIRFYAEVPLKSSGIVIGSICVADTKPRYGLDAASLDMLTEVAAAIASHLDLVQAQNQLRRSQEMVRGLGRFVEGKVCVEGQSFISKQSLDLSSRLAAGTRVTVNANSSFS